MWFIAVLLFFLASGLYVSTLLSPYTEMLMRRIWSDPTDMMKVKIAKRVKELCVDSDVPTETAVLMIAKESNIMESQVSDMMRAAAADPVIMRLAFGSRVGGMLVRAIKKCGLIGR